MLSHIPIISPPLPLPYNSFPKIPLSTCDYKYSSLIAKIILKTALNYDSSIVITNKHWSMGHHSSLPGRLATGNLLPSNQHLNFLAVLKEKFHLPTQKEHFCGFQFHTRFRLQPLSYAARAAYVPSYNSLLKKGQG